MMDIDHFFHRETLVKRRPWYVLAAVLFVLSLLTRQPVLFLFALFALVIGLVPEIWYRHALHHLVIRQYVSQQRVFLGENLTLSISVENQKLLPLPWLEVVVEIPSQITLLTGHASPSYKENRSLLVTAFSLWSFQRVTRRYHLSCLARGVYTFGPVMQRSGDPFGWLVCEEQVSVSEKFLVYPLVAPIESFGLPSRRPFGERATRQRLLEDPQRFAGVREYRIGDDLRSIHWKATARTGELCSKIYEPSSQHHLLIFLDIATYREPWMGIDPEIEELSITAAASLAMWGLDNGYSVGLFANTLMLPVSDEHTRRDTASVPPSVGNAQPSIPRVRVPLARDGKQRERILSALAQLLPYLSSSIDDLIEKERARVPLGATVVLVGAVSVLREATIERLIDLRRRGAVVSLMLTGDTVPEMGIVTYDMPVYFIGGREKWHELIKTLRNETSQSLGQSATSFRLD